MAIAQDACALDNSPPGLSWQYYPRLLRFSRIATESVYYRFRDSFLPLRPPTDGIITVHPVTSMVNNVTDKLRRAPPSYNFARVQVPACDLYEPSLRELQRSQRHPEGCDASPVFPDSLLANESQSHRSYCDTGNR